MTYLGTTTKKPFEIENMKFAQHLSTHITAEWEKQYINYNELKDFLDSAKSELRAVFYRESKENSEDYLIKFQKDFFTCCENELKKVNSFFLEKISEANRKFKVLESELNHALADHVNKGKYSSNVIMKINPYEDKVPARKLREIEVSFREFYLSLVILQNYQLLNYDGFRKILKKYDKTFGTDFGYKWCAEEVECSPFHMNNDICRLIRSTETLVTLHLEGGDRDRALNQLRAPPFSEYHSFWTTFNVGFFVGSFISLLPIIFFSALSYGDTDKVDFAVHAFRAPLLVVFYLILAAANIYGWRRSGVNYVLIFQLPPKKHLTDQYLLGVAALLGIIWSFSFLGFIYGESVGINPYLCPLAMYIIIIAFMINPIDIFFRSKRFSFMITALRILSAPFSKVEFGDFWYTEQLTSLVPCLLDLQYVICFYTNRNLFHMFGDENGDVISGWNNTVIKPLIACFPFWCRFLQSRRRASDNDKCESHITNSWKDLSVCFVILLFNISIQTSGTIFDLKQPYICMCWVFGVICAAILFLWDVKEDWALFDKNHSIKSPLRDTLLFPIKFYYFAIVLDFLGRFLFMWCITDLLLDFPSGYLTVTICGLIEIFRRFIWNYIRLENEHLYNVGKFREISDISVAPKESSDEILIVKMMDEPDDIVDQIVRKRSIGPRYSITSKQ